MTLTLPLIPSLDQTAQAVARERQDTLTKPPGSLGRLEALSIQLAAITGQPRPSVARKAAIVMAGDHGVTAEGVSAYPAEVTPQMVLNFLNGGAAINVLARQASARVIVVDMGVAADLPEHSDLQNRKVAYGTQNMALGPAMTRAQAEEAISAGLETVEAEVAAGLDLVATGDMGIGNTTASAAIVAVLCNTPVDQVTGRGTGVDDAVLARKIEVIKRAEMPTPARTPTRFWRLIRLPPRLLYALGLGPLYGRLVLLLTTAGRKSGLPRVTPLQYEEIDGAIYVASARGQQSDWFRNILANPSVVVRVKSRRFQGEATPITDPSEIADFLELRLRRHPRMVGAMMRAAGLPKDPTRAQLESYAANRAMVVIRPSGA